MHTYFIVLETSKDEGWRCPGCRTLSLTVPSVYKCFCGKMVEPMWTPSNKFQVPHSCGELCGRRLATDKSLACMHKCHLLCHPGPCPPCPVTVSTHCPCGKKPYPLILLCNINPTVTVFALVCVSMYVSMHVYLCYLIVHETVIPELNIVMLKLVLLL